MPEYLEQEAASAQQGITQRVRNLHETNEKQALLLQQLQEQEAALAAAKSEQEVAIQEIRDRVNALKVRAERRALSSPPPAPLQSAERGKAAFNLRAAGPRHLRSFFGADGEGGAVWSENSARCCLQAEPMRHARALDSLAEDLDRLGRERAEMTARTSAVREQAPLPAVLAVASPPAAASSSGSAGDSAAMPEVRLEPKVNLTEVASQEQDKPAASAAPAVAAVLPSGPAPAAWERDLLGQAQGLLPPMGGRLSDNGGIAAAGGRQPRFSSELETLPKQLSFGSADPSSGRVSDTSAAASGAAPLPLRPSDTGSGPGTAGPPPRASSTGSLGDLPRSLKSPAKPMSHTPVTLRDFNVDITTPKALASSARHGLSSLSVSESEGASRGSGASRRSAAGAEQQQPAMPLTSNPAFLGAPSRESSGGEVTSARSMPPPPHQSRAPALPVGGVPLRATEEFGFEEEQEEDGQRGFATFGRGAAAPPASGAAAVADPWDLAPVASPADPWDLAPVASPADPWDLAPVVPPAAAEPEGEVDLFGAPVWNQQPQERQDQPAAAAAASVSPVFQGGILSEDNPFLSSAEASSAEPFAGGHTKPFNPFDSGERAPGTRS